MITLETINFKHITDREKYFFEEKFEEFAKRNEKKIKNANVKIHLKEYEKEGSRHKFSIHASITMPITIEADAFGWDFNKTLNKLFKKLEEEIEHRFHISDQHNK